MSSDLLDKVTSIENHYDELSRQLETVAEDYQRAASWLKSAPISRRLSKKDASTAR